MYVFNRIFNGDDVATENCTVTIAHSRSRDLPGITRRADIVVAAAGRPEMVKGDWIKPGAIVIDVGINRIGSGDTAKLVGDVEYASAAAIARAITPVSAACPASRRSDGWGHATWSS